ncbi:MAG: chemoreceptor glutamine deamidase CheD [Alphaproteobacteria bacterium]
MTAQGIRKERRSARSMLGGRGTATHRFFDPQEDKWIIKVLPGQFYVTADPNEVIATVLGSCVAACIRDPETGFGGLNHFMLPEDMGHAWGGADSSLRYGTFAMERLINEIVRTGCPRERLEIKLFGGSILQSSQILIGSKNAEFVRRFLAQEQLPIAGEDLGGRHARRIHFYPVTGRARRKFVMDAVETDLVTAEKTYRSMLVNEEQTGDIELFR